MSESIPRKPRIMIGWVGLNVDQDHNWRPSDQVVGEAGIDEWHLIYADTPAFRATVEQVQRRYAEKFPHVVIHLHVIPDSDRWDLIGLFTHMFDLARRIALDASGAEFFVHLTTGTFVGMICTFALTESRHFPGKLVIVENNTSNLQIVDLDSAASDLLRSRFRSRGEVARQVASRMGLVTRSAAFDRIFLRLGAAVPYDDPILLLGATGTGKTTLARGIHAEKVRTGVRRDVFVELNCATLQTGLLMSHLFGHEKGAFTGADKEHRGALARADGGTLFLDEIGHLSMEAQAALLTALEDGTFTPVGGSRTARADFHLVCGTSRDLLRMVAEGSFLLDLFSRISYFDLSLPALRERPEDILPMLLHAIHAENEARGWRVVLGEAERAHFLARATEPASTWVGNARDLLNLARQLCRQATNERITQAQIDEAFGHLQDRWARLAPVAAMSLPAAAPVAMPVAVTEPALPDLCQTPRLLALVGEVRFEEIDLFSRPTLELSLQILQEEGSFAAAEHRLKQATARKKKKTRSSGETLARYFTVKFEITREVLAAAGYLWKERVATRTIGA